MQRFPAFTNVIKGSNLNTHSEADFERLELLFRRASSLPELPGSAMRLIQVIDSGAASAIDLERIIAADPGLSTSLLRISNARVPGMEPPGVSTIRAAIMRLGQRSVRTLAVSLILQNISHGKEVAPQFQVDRFAKHSLFVAFLARYLYARRNLAEQFESRWSADEIFAGALLHDISLALLARSSADSYLRVFSFATRTNISLEASFLKIFGKPVAVLGRTAVDSWDLPDVFKMAISFLAEPWKHPQEYTALCCLNYANYLAVVHGITTEEWPCNAGLIPEVEAEIALADDEAAKVLAFVDQQVASYLDEPNSAAA
jgi:HD-like signal output (HDOD) protein